MSNAEAILIGPGASFGHELVGVLLERYAVVHLVARNVDRLEALKGEFPDAAIEIHGMDVTSETFQDELRSLIGGRSVGAVIYNIMCAPKGGLELPADELLRSYDANVIGFVKALQVVAKREDISTSCTFIATGGGFKDTPHPRKIALSSSKAALHNLIVALKDEVAEAHVRLETVVIDGKVGVSPGCSIEEVIQDFENFLK